jgi:uncharacterized membrane protein YhiD involved in acid resistance
MAKLFIGISAAFMLLTAVVSFMLKGKVDALQTDRKDAKGKISMAEAQAVTAKNQATKAQEAEKAATEKATAATDAATKAQQDADTAKKEVAEKVVLIESKDKEIASLNEKLKGNPGQPVADPNEVATLKAQITDLTAQRDKAAAEAAEKAQLFDSSVAKNKANEEQLARLQRLEHERDAKLGKAGLRARVLAVNGGWNFVVLSVGDKQGITVDDPLIVVRGGDPVAKLRITSVEPSTSIADVIPSSVRRGISIQPGDTVIFQGRTPATQPENKPAAEPPTNVTTAPVTQPGQ